jgi:hypothetical protein
MAKLQRIIRSQRMAVRIASADSAGPSGWYLNLYYDIELRESISHTNAGGGMFRTTTLITKNRIFVPVPEALAEEFKVSSSAKEVFVRFDVLSSPETPKDQSA